MPITEHYYRNLVYISLYTIWFYFSWCGVWLNYHLLSFLSPCLFNQRIMIYHLCLVSFGVITLGEKREMDCILKWYRAKYICMYLTKIFICNLSYFLLALIINIGCLQANIRKKILNSSKWSSCCGAGEMNTISIHEDVGSIPGLTQWARDPSLETSICQGRGPQNQK